MQDITAADAERFWSRVGRIENPDDCTTWNGRLDPYGRFRTGGKRGPLWRAPRVAWTLCHGPIPKGACVLHHCDNPPCVAHLFLGTRRDNNADKMRKGRHVASPGLRNGKHTKPECTPLGEAHGMAKLTAEQVAVIHASRGIRNGHALALRFNVTDSTISSVKRGHTWAHQEVGATKVL